MAIPHLMGPVGSHFSGEISLVNPNLETKIRPHECSVSRLDIGTATPFFSLPYNLCLGFKRCTWPTV